tara:strand:+ start:26645 stop:26845 length:201 start_codon:yes stop_codon:yes gene_type:complete
MKYILTLDMDNEQAERCRVAVAFHADSFKRFGGFASIHSDRPLYSEDLAHLEEWVVMGKNNWHKLQ